MSGRANTTEGTGLRSNRRTAVLGYSACALAGCLGGTGFYWGRIALDEMSVESMVLYRFLFACMAMVPVLLANRGRSRLARGEMRTLLISAFFGIPVQFLLQFHGLALTTVSHAALMVGSMPVLLAAAAALFAGERLDIVGWIALAASTLGTCLIVLGGHRGPTAHGEPTLLGDLLVVVSLVTSLTWVLLSKKLMQNHSPVVVTSHTVLAGTGMLAVIILSPWLCSPVVTPLLHLRFPAPAFAHVSLHAWMALALSGIFCTALTTLLWNWGIHHVPASRAGVFLNIEPALGSVLGVQLLGEHLGPYAWLGGGLIVAAAITLTTREHAPNSITAPEVLLE